MAAAGDPPAPSTRAPGLRCVLWHPAGSQLPTDLLNSLTRRIAQIAVCTDPYTALAEVCIADRALRRHTGEIPPGSGGGTVLILIHPERLGEIPEVIAEMRTHAPGALCWKFVAGANPKLSAVVESDVTSWVNRESGGTSAVAGTGSLPNPARTTNRDDQQTRSSNSSPLPPAAAAARRAPGVPALRLADGEPPPTPPPVRAEEHGAPDAGGSRQSPAAPRLTLRGEAHPDGNARRPALTRPVLTAEEMRMLLGDEPVEGADQPRTNGRRGGNDP